MAEIVTGNKSCPRTKLMKIGKYLDTVNWYQGQRYPVLKAIKDILNEDKSPNKEAE